MYRKYTKREIYVIKIGNIVRPIYDKRGKSLLLWRSLTNPFRGCRYLLCHLDPSDYRFGFEKGDVTMESSLGIFYEFVYV